MRLFAVLLIVISLLFTFLTPGHSSRQEQVPSGYDLIVAVNALRASNGLNAYSVDPFQVRSTDCLNAHFLPNRIITSGG
jgi:hypothetical protein